MGAEAELLRFEELIERLEQSLDDNAQERADLLEAIRAAQLELAALESP